MTMTKTFASKLVVALVAVAMVVTAFASTAKAQTTDELQAMINDLLAQVAALQSHQTGMESSSSDVCPYTWTRDLSQGSTGSDVMMLQQFLNSDADTRVSAEGAGSAGMETEYYGPATAAAVSKFQVKYRSEVLSPSNLVNPTGYFGPSSRAKANGLCIEQVVEEEVEDEVEDEDEEDEDEDFELGGIASLDTFEIDGAQDDEIEEGANDAEVAEVTLEFANGDAEISIMDVSFAPVGTTDAWDVLEEVSLWVDGDKVAELDASDEDDYLNDDTGTLRFSNLGLIAMEDEEVEVIIAVSTRGNIDSSDLNVTYTVAVDSMRYFDADGVATTENSSGSFSDFGTTETFSIQEAGYEDEIRVRTSSNDPDATTLQLEDNSRSDWYTVFVFDIDTDDSINDIEINEIPLTVNLSSSTYSAIVDDAELVIDGVVIDDFTVTNGGTNLATLEFDVDGDVVIDAGDRVEAQLMLRFNSLALGNEGMTVDAEITTTNVDNIDAEGADDLENTPTDQLTGSAQGEAHTLRTSGIDVSLEDISAAVTSVDGPTNDYATYEIEVEVTAFEQDVFIAVDPAVSIGYVLQDSSGSTSIAGARSVVLTSTADEGGAGNAYFEINEGQTETLTLTVTYTPGVAQTASRLALQDITFDESGTVTTADDKTQTTLPASTYRTSVVTIVN